MKLIGIEFQDFACFDKKFVGITDGLKILVGRNNSGKTALLRGITLLGDLGVEPRRTSLRDFAGYARAETSFGLNVTFESESEDPTVFQGEQVD